MGGSIFVGSTVPFLIASIFSMFLLLAFHVPSFAFYKTSSGITNWVTFIRFMIISVSVYSFSVLSTWIFFVLMIFAVLLDVVDGYLARKFNAQSAFGRIFDMESDAFFVSCMGLYFYLTTNVGIFLLLPGALRYFYRLLVWLGPSVSSVEKKQKYATFLAGSNFVFLLAAIVLEGVAQSITLWLSICIVTFSFSVSFMAFFKGIKGG